MESFPHVHSRTTLVFFIHQKKPAMRQSTTGALCHKLEEKKGQAMSVETVTFPVVEVNGHRSVSVGTLIALRVCQ